MRKNLGSGSVGAINSAINMLYSSPTDNCKCESDVPLHTPPNIAHVPFEPRSHIAHSFCSSSATSRRNDACLAIKLARFLLVL